MIDRLVNTLFRWTRLRKAIFAETHLYDYLDEVMTDPKAMSIAATFWPDEDGWRSWNYNEDKNRYYFNDIPEHSFTTASIRLDEMENFSHAGYGFDELKDFDDGYKNTRRGKITPFRGPIR